MSMRSACATTRFGPQKQRLVTSAVGRWPRQRPEATDQRATWSAEAAHRWWSLHVRDTNLQPQSGDRTPYVNITWSTSIYKFHKSLSVILSVCRSVSRISRKPFTRSPLRSAGMLHGYPRMCTVKFEVVSMRATCTLN